MRYEIILDGGETPNKCTIAPLSGRADFRIFRVRRGGPLGPFTAPILLHPDGPCITELRGTPVSGLAAIDCVWSRLAPIVSRLQGPTPQLARIPSGFETAYPRRNSHGKDPSEGLATIEAIFLAAALLGVWDPSLLSEYYFGRAFVVRNASRLVELGVAQAADPARLPPQLERVRDARTRRRDRGRERTAAPPTQR